MSPVEAAVVLAAVVLGALVKAVTGMGFPLIVVPVASLFVPVETAVVVVAFPNLLANGALAWRERHAWPDTRDLPVLLPASIAGAVLGTALLVSLPERALTISLAGAVVVYLATRVTRPDFEVGPTLSARLAVPMGFLSGVFQGAIGVAGPVVGSWIHSFRLSREAHVLSVTALFLFSGATQFVLLVADGQYDRDRTLATVAAIAPSIGLIPLGERLRRGLSGEGFDLAVLGLLAVSVVALVIRSITG